MILVLQIITVFFVWVVNLQNVLFTLYRHFIESCTWLYWVTYDVRG